MTPGQIKAVPTTTEYLNYLTKGNLMRREAEQGVNHERRADHWIYLDRTWAQLLGVRRTAGTYRIRSRDLFRRISQENLGRNGSGAVCACEEPIKLRRSA